MAFADDGEILGASIDHVQDVGAYPTPWPVGTSVAVGMLFPGPYRIPKATWATTSVFSNTPGRTAYRGPVGRTSRSPARSCSTSPRGASASIPSSCAAATSSPATTSRTSNPTGMPYDHMSPREVFEAALEQLDYDGVPP